MSYASIYKPKVEKACKALLEEIRKQKDERTKELIKRRENRRWWESKERFDDQIFWVGLHRRQAENVALDLLSLCEHTPDHHIHVSTEHIHHIEKYLE